MIIAHTTRNRCIHDITLEQPAQSPDQSDAAQKKTQKSYHRVQILDPAAGTGTFLAEVVRNIYRRFENQRGMWRSYVGERLIPRLNGFEILMASYAMAHLKLDMLLQETGYTSDADNRLRIYLTNSLTAANDKVGKQRLCKIHPFWPAFCRKKRRRYFGIYY